MKAKLLLMLFLVSLSLGVFASEHHQKKPHAVCKVYEKVATRIPFIFSVQTEDINDCLYLTFQFSLAYIIHSGFISGYQNRYGDNLKPPTNVYHRMTA